MADEKREERRPVCRLCRDTRRVQSVRWPGSWKWIACPLCTDDVPYITAPEPVAPEIGGGG